MNPRNFSVSPPWAGRSYHVTPWVWLCTMCRRCVHACPMNVDIPQLVYLCRQSWPREERPKGILGSCEQALNTPGNSAMGASSEDFKFVVEDVLEEVRESQPGMQNLLASVDRKGAYYFLNQNSREPVTEPDEMVPLWKILNLVGADWTYSTRAGPPRTIACSLPMTSGNRGSQQGQGRGGSGVQGLAQHGVRTRILRSPGRTAKVQCRA